MYCVSNFNGYHTIFDLVLVELVCFVLLNQKGYRYPRKLVYLILSPTLTKKFYLERNRNFFPDFYFDVNLIMCLLFSLFTGKCSRIFTMIPCEVSQNSLIYATSKWPGWYSDAGCRSVLRALNWTLQGSDIQAARFKWDLL